MLILGVILAVAGAYAITRVTDNRKLKTKTYLILTILSFVIMIVGVVMFAICLKVAEREAKENRLPPVHWTSCEINKKKLIGKYEKTDSEHKLATLVKEDVSNIEIRYIKEDKIVLIRVTTSEKVEEVQFKKEELDIFIQYVKY